MHNYPYGNCDHREVYWAQKAACAISPNELKQRVAMREYFEGRSEFYTGCRMLPIEAERRAYGEMCNVFHIAP